MMRVFSFLLLFLSLTACADIDKGLYSLSDAVAPVDRVTGQRSLNITSRASQINQSNQIGAQTLQKYASAGKPVNAKVDAAQYQRLQRIFGRIHAVSHLRNEKWTAVLLPDYEWNAYTNGGTYIFIYKKLMEETSDDELASVIGHEIGHVTANHVYEAQSYVLASSLKGSKGASKPSFRNAFTVTQEEEADRLGVLYSALAGYDPFAASRVWKKIYDEQGDMLSNHPTNSRRYQMTQALAEEYSRYYTPGKINSGHATVLASLSSGGPALKPGAGAGLMAVLQTTADVLTKHNQVKTVELDQRATAQFTQYVGQSIVLIDRRLLDARTLQVTFGYKGAYPVKGLNLVAIAGKEQSNAHMQGVIPPGATLTAQFGFNAADLTQGDINSIRIAAIHAERAL